MSIERVSRILYFEVIYLKLLPENVCEINTTYLNRFYAFNKILALVYFVLHVAAFFTLYHEIIWKDTVMGVLEVMFTTIAVLKGLTTIILALRYNRTFVKCINNIYILSYNFEKCGANLNYTRLCRIGYLSHIIVHASWILRFIENVLSMSLSHFRAMHLILYTAVDIYHSFIKVKFVFSVFILSEYFRSIHDVLLRTQHADIVEQLCYIESVIQKTAMDLNKTVTWLILAVFAENFIVLVQEPYYFIERLLTKKLIIAWNISNSYLTADAVFTIMVFVIPCAICIRSVSTDIFNIGKTIILLYCR